VVGKIIRDQTRNTKIRNQLKQESVEVLMEKRKLRWLWTRSKDGVEKKNKISAEGKTRTKSGKGGPRVKWEEYVEGIATKKGRKLPEVRRLAHDRDEYRKWLLNPDA
jgi:hypothetical protein